MHLAPKGSLERHRKISETGSSPSPSPDSVADQARFLVP